MPYAAVRARRHQFMPFLGSDSLAPVFAKMLPRGEAGRGWRPLRRLTAPLLLGFPLHRRASSVVRRTSGGAGSVTKSRPPQVTNGDKNWPLGGR
jgi:hypothetical protein